MEIVTTQNLNKLSHKFKVIFAIFCAKQVTSYLNKETSKDALKAIEAAELWLDGKVTKEECYTASTVAYAAAGAANAAAHAAYAAHAAAAAAYAANAAAYAAANAANAAHTANAAANANAAAAAYAGASAKKREQVIKAQWVYYNELLNFDNIFEKEVL